MIIAEENVKKAGIRGSSEKGLQTSMYLTAQKCMPSACERKKESLYQI